MIRLLAWLIGWVAPPGAHAWVQAMRAEIAAIDDAGAARRFALGCVRAAVIFRARLTADNPQHITTTAIVPARRLFLLAICGSAAAAIGVLYLAAASAPQSLIIVNTLALLLGVLLVVGSRRVRGLRRSIVNGTAVAIAAVLLLTAVTGHAVDGVARWVQLGSLSVQTSLLLLPVALLLFAHRMNRWTTAAMVVIAIAIALQPDRAMALALCAGLVALLFVRRRPAVVIACGASSAAMLVTCLRADPLPAVPFVDHILWSSFRLHPLLGVALWLGSALLFVPLLLMRSTNARNVCLPSGVCWGALVVAAAAGAYPTPVVGFGSAAILGYFLCIAALGALTTDSDEGQQAMTEHSPALRRDGDRVQSQRTVRGMMGLHTVHAAVLCTLLLVVGSRRAGGQRATDECARSAVKKLEGPGVWQPGPEGRQLSLWPDGQMIERPETGGQPEYVGNGSPLVAGRLWNWATYVSRPTMTIYRPAVARSRAAIVVLPGGGYAAVAMDLEGTEICDWITAQGVTCVLLKYRVPQQWPRDARGVGHPPARQLPLQDAQRAIGLLRARAVNYDLDSRKIGVIGFSAGGHLAAAVSNAEQLTYAGTDAADRQATIPDFAILLYPGRLWDSRSRAAGLALAQWVTISTKAPPTLLIHAMNDPVDDVRHSAAYGLALHEAGVPVDMRFYAKGCHAFGLRATSDPITTEWPDEVVRWLRQLGMLTTSDQR
jgi:acetyl esterase/lipase